MNTIIGHPGTLDSFATSLLTIDIYRQQATHDYVATDKLVELINTIDNYDITNAQVIKYDRNFCHCKVIISGYSPK